MKLDGTRLRQKRHAEGWSLDDVVSAVRKARKQITVGTVSNAENGHEIHPGSAKKICDALGVEIRDYMLPMEGSDHEARKDNSRSRSTKRSLSKSARVA